MPTRGWIILKDGITKIGGLQRRGRAGLAGSYDQCGYPKQNYHLTNAQCNAQTATDITGFDILGHSQNLVKQQRVEVSFGIHHLPIVAKMAIISKASGKFELLQGISAETLGVLRICLLSE